MSKSQNCRPRRGARRIMAPGPHADKTRPWHPDVLTARALSCHSATLCPQSCLLLGQRNSHPLRGWNLPSKSGWCPRCAVIMGPSAGPSKTLGRTPGLLQGCPRVKCWLGRTGKTQSSLEADQLATLGAVLPAAACSAQPAHLQPQDSPRPGGQSRTLAVSEGTESAWSLKGCKAARNAEA